MTAPAATSPGKPPEVEEWVDARIHRPLARRVVRVLVLTPVTPNQVTVISALLGVAAGAAAVRGIASPGWMLAAAALLFASVVFDCADGQLARARATSSTYGAVYDGLADYAVGLALGISGSWIVAAQRGDAWFALLGLAGTASIAVQSALFDNTKTRYLARIRTGYAEREEDLGRLEADLGLAWRRRRLRDAFLLWTYLQYTRAQHRAMAVPPAGDPAAFRESNRARMRAWTWLGSGTHFALGYTAFAAASWWPRAVEAYFVLHLTLFNVFLAALVWRGRRAGTL